MRTSVLRTNLFRFDPHSLPCAYKYHATERYATTWSLLQSYWQEKKRGYLPTRGLVEMLAILSRGPAWVNPDPGRSFALPAIVTLLPMDVTIVNQALRLWALDVLQEIEASSDDVLVGLAIDAAAPMPMEDLLPANQPIQSIAYSVVPWLISSAMARSPMASTVPLQLQTTSEGDLVAWDNPIVAETEKRKAIALHCVEPKLVLLRGEKAPLVAIRVHLSHLLPQWKHKSRHTWLHINDSIVKLPIYTTRTADGNFETLYSGSAERLLGHMGIDQFPKLGQGELSPSGPLRPIHAKTPSTPLIANGTGPLFLDQACWHFARTVGGAESVLVDRVVGSLRKSTITGADVSVGSPPVLAITAHARTAVRLEAARRLMSSDSYFSFKGGRLPQVDMVQIAPARAGAMLCESSKGTELVNWFQHEIVPEIRRTGAGTAIVETSIEAAKGRAEGDPKFQLRRLFARENVTTQFIFDVEPGDTDFAANASLIEVVRQSGTLPAPMLRVKKLPEESTVVSVYLDRIKAKGSAIFLPSITRMKIESGVPEIFWRDQQTGLARWVDYRAGIALMHSSTNLLTADEAKKFIEQALLAPTNTTTTPLIVYLHSNLRTIYTGLRDSGGSELPRIATEGAWVVRIRADEDTAQMSGDQTKHPSGPGYVGHRIGLYKPRDSMGIYYFVSPSNQYGRVISQRSRTRFDVVNRALRDPWQQLGVTEIAVIRAGAFGTHDDIAHQSALLCRNAPMWEGNLRLPAPMHMAKQVAQDHPLIEINRRMYAD